MVEAPDNNALQLTGAALCVVGSRRRRRNLSAVLCRPHEREG
jgi:hypothetical protein